MDDQNQVEKKIEWKNGKKKWTTKTKLKKKIRMEKRQKALQIAPEKNQSKRKKLHK